MVIVDYHDDMMEVKIDETENPKQQNKFKY